jgi:hypothetical protein
MIEGAGGTGRAGRAGATAPDTVRFWLVIGAQSGKSAVGMVLKLELGKKGRELEEKVENRKRGRLEK